MVRASRLALPALILASSTCLAQVAPQSYTGSYLNQPNYGIGQAYGAGQGYASPYGQAGRGYVNPYTGTTTYPNNATGYGTGYPTSGYGTGYQNGTIGTGTGYPTNGYGQQQGIPQQVITPTRTDDVMTLGKAGSAKDKAGIPVSAPAATTSAQRPDPRGQVINGSAKVVDGKTLIVGTDLVVLNGADAPAADQTCTDENGMAWECGRKSMDRLVQLTMGQRVYCVGLSNGGAGVVATCKVGTVDLGKTMVQDGLALSPRAVAPIYLSEEIAARNAKRGMWVGTFKNPWDLRAGK